MSYPLNARVLGRIEFSGKDMPTQPARYDRLAVGKSNDILLVSVIAESQYIKAIRAILSGGAKAEINASVGKIMVPDSQYGYRSNPGRLVGSEKYECHPQKLEFGLVHAMFVTRKPGFMPVMSDDSLWAELQTDRFTTPMLREWLPWIKMKLMEMDLLSLCSSFNFPYMVKGEDGQMIEEVMRCGMLEAQTRDLDGIVTDGLRNGNILIPESRRATVAPTQLALAAPCLVS